MKSKSIYRLLVGLVLSTQALVVTGCTDITGTLPNGQNSNTPQTAQEISDEMERSAPSIGTDANLAWQALTSAEGEYAAAASYEAVLDKYGQVEPYASILDAELRHIGALTRQLNALGVNVPSNPYIGVVEAPENLQLAAEAWANGEVANVAMYDRLLQSTESSTLLRVFGNLRRSSQESHLPLFTLAAANGGTLTASQMPSMHG